MIQGYIVELDLERDSKDDGDQGLDVVCERAPKVNCEL